MTKNIYDETLMEQLEKNPHIKSMSQKSITFRPEFKLKAVMDYKKGKKPVQIFCEQGFNLDLFDADYARNCIRRWTSLYDKYGAEGILTDHRGCKGSR